MSKPTLSDRNHIQPKRFPRIVYREYPLAEIVENSETLLLVRPSPGLSSCSTSHFLPILNYILVYVMIHIVEM